MLTSLSESVSVVIAAGKDSRNIAANAELTHEAGWQAEASLIRSGSSGAGGAGAGDAGGKNQEAAQDRSATMIIRM
jgi:hypothetical protein